MSSSDPQRPGTDRDPLSPLCWRPRRTWGWSYSWPRGWRRTSSPSPPEPWTFREGCGRRTTGDLKGSVGGQGPSQKDFLSFSRTLTVFWDGSWGALNAPGPPSCPQLQLLKNETYSKQAPPGLLQFLLIPGPSHLWSVPHPSRLPLGSQVNSQGKSMALKQQTGSISQQPSLA